MPILLPISFYSIDAVFGRLTRSKTEFSRPSDNSTLAFFAPTSGWDGELKRETGVWRRTRRCSCVHADSRLRISKLLRLGVDLGQSDTGSADRGGHTCRRHSYVHATDLAELGAYVFSLPLRLPFLILATPVSCNLFRHNTGCHQVSQNHPRWLAANFEITLGLPIERRRRLLGHGSWLVTTAALSILLLRSSQVFSQIYSLLRTRLRFRVFRKVSFE